MRLNPISFNEAMKKVLSCQVLPVGKRRVFLYEALGRVLAEDIIAPSNMPEERRSAMDGYLMSVSAWKNALASPEPEVTFEVGRSLRAGGDYTLTLEDHEQHQVLKVFTGAKIPDGGEIFILKEEIKTQTDHQITVDKQILQSAHPLRHIREVGENYALGDVLLKRGERIQAAEVGLLASLNQLFVSIYDQPKVAIICGGDELVDLGEVVSSVRSIRSVNNHLLHALVQEAGGIPLSYPLLNDNKEEILSCFNHAVSEADMVIFSGGMSVGDFDFIPHILEKEAEELLFYGVKMKPGKPIAYAKVRQKHIFGLGGFSNSTYVGFYHFVRPILAALCGYQFKPILLNGILQEDVKKHEGRTEFRSCHICLREGDIYVSMGDRKKIHSAAINHLCGQSAFMILDEGVTELKVGSKVTVTLMAGLKSLELGVEI